ncbi:hypothetical protein DXG01_008009 [Tephrocybe rancida]|nr:hypothetical protein DXG01_008009 [Tephrocybe rancida]
MAPDTRHTRTTPIQTLEPVKNLVLRPKPRTGKPKPPRSNFPITIRRRSNIKILKTFKAAYPRYYGGGQSESESHLLYLVLLDTESMPEADTPTQRATRNIIPPSHCMEAASHHRLFMIHQRRQRQEEERQQQDLERQQREQQQRLEQEQLERERHEREQRRHERRERERQERERQELHEREQRRHERQELERQELERRERGRQQQRLVHEHHPWDQLRRMGNRTASQRHPPDADRARSSAAAPPAAERFVGVKTSQGWTVPPLLHSAPPSWPLIEFRQREHLPAPMMFFDISQDPNDPTEGRGIRLLARERSFGISTPFLEEHKNLPFAKTVKMKMIDMVCTAPELKEWNVVIKSEDVIRVIDVFEAIYKTYQVPLTPAELDKYRHLVNSSACQRAFKRRCEKSHGLTYVNRMRGVCRVDLVGDRTLFLKVHMGETSRRYEFDLIMQDHSADICQSVIPRNPNPVGHYMP